MKKFLVYTFMLLIGWSCTKQEIDYPTGRKAYISFSSPKMELTNVSTRALVEGASFSEGKFGVLGYCLALNDDNSGATTWENKKGFANPHLFYKQSIDAVSGAYTATNTTTNTEISNGKAPWYTDNSYLYTFFAYYPFDGWDISPTSMTAIGEPQATYTITQDKITNNTIPDLMAASLVDKKKEDGRLAFTFKHLLSGLNINIINNTDADVKVNNLTIKGNFHQKVAVGLNLTPTISGTLNNCNFNYGTFNVAKNKTTTSSTLLLPTNGTSFSPGGNGSLTISGNGTAEISYNLSNLASFTPQPGVIYTLNIVFAGSQVTFYATSDNNTWEDGGDNGEVVFQ